MNEVNESSFKSLHSQYHGMVLTLCRGFMRGDSDLTHDLTQDVFINVWNALPGYRAEASYKTWIYRITVNTCLLQIRKEKNKVNVPLEVAVHKTESNTDNEQIEKELMLYQAIGQLDELERIIIMMVLEEVEYDEIARIIGITENNLRVKIHRTRSKLKTIIENGK